MVYPIEVNSYMIKYTDKLVGIYYDSITKIVDCISMIDIQKKTMQIRNLIGFETWLQIIVVSNDSNVIWSGTWNATDNVIVDFLRDI